MIRKHFRQCDICGIGLGTFDYKKCSSRMIKKWIIVVGEDGYKWEWGSIIQRFMKLKTVVNKLTNHKRVDLVWTSRVISPEHVCWECLQKYHPTNDKILPCIEGKK